MSTGRARLLTSALALVVLGLAASAASGATVRPGFVETPIASGLANPTAMAFSPDGRRLFVCEQGGRLRVILDGTLLPTPFVQLTVNAAGERGLLGVALDPLFPAQPYVYVYYTATTPTIHNRVSRFTAAGDVAVPGSELVLLELPTLSATNHNGGALHFDADGLLYIGVGENAVGANSQSLATPLGKMLRIARDGTIPASNPSFGQTTGTSRAIWALGLRNPFTFAIDPASGRMLINDVGQNAWEEINEGAAGANYGWPATEGPTSDPRFTAPLHAYSHAATGGCAITGAAFYPSLPSAYPASYAGDYFFADLCAGWIRQLDVGTRTVHAEPFASGIAAPVDLAIGPEGSLYYLARGAGGTTGVVSRIDATNDLRRAVPRAPVARILTPAAGTRATAGSTVFFSASANDRDGPLPAAAFVWEITAHRGEDVQTIVGPLIGVTSGTFTIPGTGGAPPDAWYRLHVTVTASSGQTATTVRDLRVAPAPVATTPVRRAVARTPAASPSAPAGVGRSRGTVAAIARPSSDSTTNTTRDPKRGKSKEEPETSEEPQRGESGEERELPVMVSLAPASARDDRCDAHQDERGAEEPEPGTCADARPRLPSDPP